jgi:integrase
MRAFSSKFSSDITDFLNFRTEMGIQTYTNELNLARFDQFCAEQYPGLATLTKDAVRGWIDDEMARGKRGLSNKLSVMRLLAKYLGGESYIAPTSLIPKLPDYVPYILSDEELTAFFAAADDLVYPADPFIQEVAPVLFRLLYTCGLRPREGRLVKRGNICFTSGEILIDQAKRMKERIVVMSPDMLDMCKRYDAKRTVVAGESELFFVTSNGKKLEEWTMLNTFKSCWQRAKPEIPEHLLPRLRPYDLRHRFASTVLQKWLDNGHNLYAKLPYLRAYMGHERFEDTAYYIHILPENLMRSPGVDWEAIDKNMPEVNVWTR